MSEVRENVSDSGREDIAARLIDLSGFLVGAIVTDLAQRGVVPKAVSVQDYWRYEAEGPAPGDADDLHALTFDAAIDWLIAEGVLRETAQAVADTENEVITYRTVVLTSFGFYALERKLFSGFKLREHAERAGAAPSRNWSSIGDAVGGLLGGFTKSMGSG